MRISLLAIALLIGSATPVWIQPAIAQDEQPPPDGSQPPPAHHHGQMRQKFEAANVTHDGRLTREQAQNGNMRRVAAAFDQIDVNHQGYVTMREISDYQRRMRAERAGNASPQGDPQGNQGPPGGPPPQDGGDDQDEAPPN